MDYIKDLHELCETLSEAIREANEKIRNSGGKLSAGDTAYVDQLTHALKSVKATIKMMEEEGYSWNYPYSYADRNIPYHGGSYAVRRNARRDSMGRYSGEQGYSRNGGMVEELRGLMQDAPDERTRQEFKRFIEKIESM